MKYILITLAAALAVVLSACANRPPPPAAPPPPAVKLAVSQTERGVMIWLPDNVLFEFGKAELSPAAGEYLDRVARLLVEKTDHQLALEGHTDNVGSADFNQGLSERRALAVARALADRGVRRERLHTAGFGFGRPLAPNDSELGRRLNRRVELVVLDETVAHLMRDEPANAFEDAFARLRRELDTQLAK